MAQELAPFSDRYFQSLLNCHPAPGEEGFDNREIRSSAINRVLLLKLCGKPARVVWLKNVRILQLSRQKVLWPLARRKETGPGPARRHYRNRPVSLQRKKFFLSTFVAPKISNPPSGENGVQLASFEGTSPRLEQ